MHKELKAVCIVFIELFILISLISYHPSDLMIQGSLAGENIHNLFGFCGAYISGILIGFFGMGAFWIPVLFVITCNHYLKNPSKNEIASTLGGGFLLVIVTGAIFAAPQDHYIIFGNHVTSGGMIGVLLKTTVAALAGSLGSILVLMLLLFIGLKLSLGFSFRNLMPSARQLQELTSSVVKPQAQKLYDLLTPKQPVYQKPSADRTEPEPVKLIPFIRRRPEKKLREHNDGMQIKTGFQLPSYDLLEDPDIRPSWFDSGYLDAQSSLLESKLADYGVKGRVTAVNPGPVITTFEYQPAAGVKINKIVNLTDDLALALSAMSIRIVAPIPGKSVIGIEIPNHVREIVKLKEVIQSEQFIRSSSRLTLCLGKDMIGNPVVAELDQMPHLLIAGATGSGKSVCLNAMICSLLYKSNPDEVKLIMIDPKRIELSIYDGIPHLITPVVTDVSKATHALYWAVSEMERRYELLSQKKVRNINRYNIKAAKETTVDGNPSERLPYIVIIIDELADLMMVASKEVEFALTRLAQMARASGIHLILATQRPSVDVLTGLIKANFPTRLSFKVSSKIDSRTIIDGNGAETLLGNGDMLFLAPGTSKLQRIHGAYISEEEVIQIADYLKEQKAPQYDHTVLEAANCIQPDSEKVRHDDMYEEAVALVARTRHASISVIKRNLRIGEKRAAKIIDLMEKDGIVAPGDGIGPREVLIQGKHTLH